MESFGVQQPINLKVVKFELNFTPFYQEQPKPISKRKEIKVPNIKYNRRRSFVPSPPLIKKAHEKRDAKDLVEDLLDELYADQRDWSNNSNYRRGSTLAPSLTSTQSLCREHPDAIERNYLETLDVDDLRKQFVEWKTKLQDTGDRLGKYVRVRDRFRRQQKKLCAALTVLIRHLIQNYAFSVQRVPWAGQMSAILNSLRNLASSSRTSTAGDNNARFGLTPGSGEGPGEGGYAEWLHAMRLVAKLPAGVPHHFRKKLWLTLSDRYLASRSIDWPAAERACFRGTAQPDDTELGAQIIKDLHRTGCSLFCGTEGRENQAMLRRVLLAYARWNKEVGYCQGFNMLAAIILEVMDKSESDSLKVMVYLVEAVLPEGYFADDLRGLSADMAAFRDLLRLRLPRLARHMDYLQRISDGGGVEPPLPDVFTMQWFLTLYATWLQRDCLLRIWDLILLDGNEVLLLTALAIWDLLQDRILSARSADEFYSCMGGGAGVIWQAGEALVARVVGFGSAPELPRLRSLHRYRVAAPAPPTVAPVYHPPVHSAMQSVTKKGLRLFYSEDEGDSSDDGNRMALATVIPKRDERSGAGDRLSLDIGALKRQYARLRERQRQAHVILAAACARHAAVGVPTSPTSLTVNNLLLGKSAIVSSRGRRLGPPPGSVPPSRQVPSTKEKTGDSPSATKKSSDTICWKEEKHKKTLSRRNSTKWKDLKKENGTSKVRKASIDLADFDEAGDGVIVSEHEANEMIASLRSRSSSETSSYSSHSASSTDTSLCDENERLSDSESELPIDNGKTKEKEHFEKIIITPSTLKKTTKTSPKLKSSKLIHSPEDKQVPNISDYLDSAAGESLRAYIDGFQAKLKDTDIKNYDNKTDEPKNNILYTSKKSADKSDFLGKQEYDLNLKSCEKIRPSKITTNFIDLSPPDISPCNFDLHHKSTYDFCFKSNQQQTSLVLQTSRPLDIIESFSMYPDFVPEIDLTEKNTLHLESPSKSPGAESIVVSEDEPPIPLKIDKYFEYSPEFFGARVTDPNSLEIPNRRAPKRLSRLPKKPDSLTLQSSHNERLFKNDVERASSLPQSHSFQTTNYSEKALNDQSFDINYKETLQTSPRTDSNSINVPTPEKVTHLTFSPKGNLFEYGRKNSEKALQIIQENSKILSRILTKQIVAEKQNSNLKTLVEVTKEITMKDDSASTLRSILEETKSNTSPLLKESTSDSLIGIKKRHNKTNKDEKNDFIRIRPISIDDPFSLEARSNVSRNTDFVLKNIKSPSSDSLGNKTDLYGWENKGFLAKCDYSLQKLSTPKIEYRKRSCDITSHPDSTKKDIVTQATPEWRHSFSGETFMSLPLNEHKDVTLDCQYMSEEYKNYPLSNRYNDFVLKKASDICSQTAEKGPKVCENLSKTDNEHSSDFTHVVTSSISFTYEHSNEGDSPIEAKSNSSDTLCQIMSLDQVSTPISPKIFSNRETPTVPKDNSEKSYTLVSKLESDETCSAITSILDTDTLSSLSYPRSPSSGSYHFPARPAMRLPKELTVRLGMYPKDTLSSPRN